MYVLVRSLSAVVVVIDGVRPRGTRGLPRTEVGFTPGEWRGGGYRASRPEDEPTEASASRSAAREVMPSFGKTR
jgi:hypothetical protein